MRLRHILIVLMLLSSSFALARTLSGKVVSVKDGDTIHILMNRTTYKIRLDGIDCPEKNQAFGTQAKAFTSNMVFGKVVRVETQGQDRYGRWLGKVYTSDGRSLNLALLRAGLAWHYKQYNKDKKLAKLENEARAKGLGLWSQKRPTPPWEFRHKKK